MSFTEVKESNDFAPTHDFTEHDTVEGQYIQKKTEIGANKSNKYVLKQSDGSVIEVWGSTVLDGKMDNVGIGQRVQIKYLGKPKGKNYKLFAVFVSEGDE